MKNFSLLTLKYMNVLTVALTESRIIWETGIRTFLEGFIDFIEVRPAYCGWHQPLAEILNDGVEKGNGTAGTFVSP